MGGLVDTLTALVLVYTAMQLPLAIALMSTYFRAVPTELKEAARIDGAGEWRTLWIVLPIVRVGIAAVASITMLPVWNDLWFPLILAPSKQNQTVTLGGCSSSSDSSRATTRHCSPRSLSAQCRSSCSSLCSRGSTSPGSRKATASRPPARPAIDPPPSQRQETPIW